MDSHLNRSPGSSIRRRAATATHQSTTASHTPPSPIAKRRSRVLTLKISASLTSPLNCCRVAESTPPSRRAARQPCPPPRAPAPRPGARSCTRAPPRLAPPRHAHRADQRRLRAAQLAERFSDRPRPDRVAGQLVQRRAARAGAVPLRSALAPVGARDERGADDVERRVADIVNRRLSEPVDPAQRVVELHHDRGHGVAARVLHLLGFDGRDRELGEHVDHVQVLHAAPASRSFSTALLVDASTAYVADRRMGASDIGLGSTKNVDQPPASAPAGLTAGSTATAMDQIRASIRSAATTAATRCCTSCAARRASPMSCGAAMTARPCERRDRGPSGPPGPPVAPVAHRRVDAPLCRCGAQHIAEHVDGLRVADPRRAALGRQPQRRQDDPHVIVDLAGQRRPRCVMERYGASRNGTCRL